MSGSKGSSGLGLLTFSWMMDSTIKLAGQCVIRVHKYATDDTPLDKVTEGFHFKGMTFRQPSAQPRGQNLVTSTSSRRIGTQM